MKGPFTGDSSVFERLSNRYADSHQRSKVLLENSHNLTNDLFDPETGQELFKPNIKRGPRGRPRLNSKEAGRNLYIQGL